MVLKKCVCVDKRTSMGLKNVILKVIGPAGIVNIVRVGVMMIPDIFAISVFGVAIGKSPNKRYAFPSTLA